MMFLCFPVGLPHPLAFFGARPALREGEGAGLPPTLNDRILITGNWLLDAQRFLTLLPVARAEFVGLQRVEHAQHFLRIASHGKVRHIRKTNDAFRIHNVRRTLRHA